MTAKKTIKSVTEVKSMVPAAVESIFSVFADEGIQLRYRLESLAQLQVKYEADKNLQFSVNCVEEVFSNHALTPAECLEAIRVVRSDILCMEAERARYKLEASTR